MATETTITAQVEAVRLAGPPKPLSLSGALDRFKQEDTTPVIGREFFGVNLVDDIINAEDADALLRDLAITSESIRNTNHSPSL